MRPVGRRARILVPLVAGVVGLVGGVVTALAVPDRDGPGAAEDVGADPLHLGIPLVDLDCTGEPVLVVGRGDSAPPLVASIADNPDLPLRYLRTDRSCATLWAPEAQGAPEYVVYAGPYDGMREPCERRMSVDNKGDVVTNLTAGNDLFVKCLCVLPVAQFPDLEPGMAVDPGSGIWVRSLQSLLSDLDAKHVAAGRAGTYVRPRDITGVYDETTQQRIRTYQPLARHQPHRVRPRPRPHLERPPRRRLQALRLLTETTTGGRRPVVEVRGAPATSHETTSWGSASGG